MKIRSRTRFLVLRRDGFRCVYCGVTASASELHIDHVHPKSKGGGDSLDNFVTACVKCNGGKGVLSIIPEAKDGVSPGSPTIVAAGPSLCGKCFVIIGHDLEPYSQGFVRAKVDDKNYLVQFFSWMTGEPTTMCLVDISTMLSRGDERTDGSWIFFEDDQHLRDWLDEATD